MKNSEFLEKYASPGAIGLVGGEHFIDRGIRKAQKKITGDKLPSFFSHAFIFSEKRADDKWWLVESDLEFHSKHLRLGVQENRVDKYYSETNYPNLAVLNFNLARDQAKAVVKEALDIVSMRAEYSLSEIIGVLFSFNVKDARLRENRFRQENAFICSSFVQHCYSKIGIELNNCVSPTNITPEDIYKCTAQHKLEQIIRE